MSRLAQENLVAGVLLVVFAVVIWLCQDFGPRARMIPLPLAILGIVLTIVQLLWQNLRSTDELQMSMIAVGERPGNPAADDGAVRAEEPPGAREPTLRAELRAFGIVALLIALVFVVGIIPAVFLFTAGYFVLTREYSWLMGLVYTTVFTLSIHLMFVWALQIEPYYGLLAPVAERFR